MPKPANPPLQNPRTTKSRTQIPSINGDRRLELFACLPAIDTFDLWISESMPLFIFDR